MEDQSRTLVKNIKKEMSDSGYGSNKSNSQYEQSSGSSKSHQSSFSSEGQEDIELNHSNSNPTIQGHQNEVSDHGQHPGSSSLQKHSNKASKKSNGKGTPIGSSELHPFTHQHSRPRQAHPLILHGKVDRSKNAPSFPRPLLNSSSRKRLRAQDPKAIEVAALTRALFCIKRFTEPVPDISETSSQENSKQFKWQESFEEHFKEEAETAKLEDGFATAVSMEDGVVVHSTSNITNVLGYPKDMWIGRNFIDFVHPKDRISFTSHITSGLSSSIDEEQLNSQGESTGVNAEPFFCRMREYRGLKLTGLGVVNKEVPYFPFKLIMKLRKVDLEESQHEQRDINQGSRCLNEVPIVRLVILAVRMKSAFQYPEEDNTNPVKFITRHSASCKFDHVDTDAISYLGHLPQDLIGHSILDYYHPEDMTLLKSIYEEVLLEQGKPFRSKPYRFRAFNGTFALMETDWSCFINPWSWKLEFVIGQHRVIKGPLNPNVFMSPNKDDLLDVSEEAKKKYKCIQDEIKILLKETVSRRLSDRCQSLRGRKNLAAKMESVLEPRMPNTGDSIKSGSQCSSTFSLMEKDTEMLGEISPYHEHDDFGSNESCETPPSYSQLNYRENIERFFLSQPKTARSNDFGKRKEANHSSTDEDSKLFADYSSASNYGHWNGSNESGDCEGFEPLLTEDLISKHNVTMEKDMTHRHREIRVKIKPNASSPNQKDAQKDARSKHGTPEQRGVKRGTNSDWCGESGKAIKLPHLESKVSESGVITSGRRIRSRSTTLWPPFSITPTTGFNTMTTTMPGISTLQYFGAPTPTLGPTLINPGVNITSPFVLLSRQTQSQYLQPVANVVPPGFVSFHPSTRSLLAYSQSTEKLLSGRPQPYSEYFGPSKCVMSVKETPSQLQPNKAFNFQTVASKIGKTKKEDSLKKPLLAHLGSTSPKFLQHHFIPESVSTPQYFRKTSSRSCHGEPNTATLLDNSEKCQTSGQQGHSKCSYLYDYTEPVPTSFAAKKFLLSKPSTSKQVNVKNNLSFKPASFTSNSDCSRDLDDSSSSSLYSLLRSSSSEGSTSMSFRGQINGSKQDKDTKVGWNRSTMTTKKMTNLFEMEVLNDSSLEDDVFAHSMNQLTISPEIIFRFQIPVLADSTEILLKDLKTLKLLGNQSIKVNKQLDELYSEIRGDKRYSHDLLEDEATSSSSDNESSISESKTEKTFIPIGKKIKSNVRKFDYSKIITFFEENAPLPPPMVKG